MNQLVCGSPRICCLKKNGYDFGSVLIWRRIFFPLGVMLLKTTMTVTKRSMKYTDLDHDLWWSCCFFEERKCLKSVYSRLKIDLNYAQKIFNRFLTWFVYFNWQAFEISKTIGQFDILERAEDVLTDCSSCTSSVIFCYYSGFSSLTKGRRGTPGKNNE